MVDLKMMLSKWREQSVNEDEEDDGYDDDDGDDYDGVVVVEVMMQW